MKFQPMLAKVGTIKVLASKDYIFEPKMDGYRAICYLEKNKKPRFVSRSGKPLDFNIEFDIDPDCTECILDGEIVFYDEFGNPDFNLLRRQQSKSTTSAVYVVFDIIKKNKEDISKLPLIERKKILEKTIKDQDQLQIIFFSENGPGLWAVANQRNLEGVMAKKKDSRYVQARSDSWLKIKLYKTIDCIILGYKTGKRKISSLRLGLYDESGSVQEIGNVGTGFTEEMLDELLRRLDEKKDSNLVCEVRYLEFNQSLRAPVFLRLRDDKSPKDCTFDQLSLVKMKRDGKNGA